MQQDVIPDAPALRARDGLHLYWREWPLKKPRGIALLVHGLGEHIGRYEHVAAKFNEWGWAACGYDHRGHGRSQGARGVIQRADDLLADLATAIDRARIRHPGVPLILVGHSLGGLVTARFAAEQVTGATGRADWSRPVDGLVLSSPALDPGMHAGQRLLLATLGRATPAMAVPNGIKVERICSDPVVVQAYVADPLVHGLVAPRLVRFIVDAGEEAARRAPHWNLPTLLLYASEERVIDPAGSARFAKLAPPAWVTTQAFQALAHEIFNEPEKEQVFERLGGWLDARFPRSQAAA